MARLYNPSSQTRHGTSLQASPAQDNFFIITHDSPIMNPLR
ncbi:hypothetical protein [Coleofasciculus chthonoplastes]